MLSPQYVEDLVLAALTLHNILRQGRCPDVYCPKGLADEIDMRGNFIPGSWRLDEQLTPLRVPSNGHNSAVAAKEVRDIFTDYFCNEGSVPWQWDRC